MIHDIISAIERGQFDAYLSQIEVACSARRAATRTVTLANIKPGDTVRFKGDISPKYLVGLEATVTKRNPKSVVVSIPNETRYGRFAGRTNVRCPLAIVTPA